MKRQAMRDAFWDRVYELALRNRDIVIVSADLGAPALDKFREKLPEQYINVGIAEQNAILVASGLALAGKKPIAYAISQFITLRCFEQIRIYPCGMNIPVTIVGVGAGACYWESGPTHHCIEQLSVLRTLPNLEVINCSEQIMAAQAADYAMSQIGPKYIQLDREVIDELPKVGIEFSKGFRILKEGKDSVIVATGNMVKEALDISKIVKTQYQKDVGVIDIFKIPMNSKDFIDYIVNVNSIVTLEENVLAGGLGSYLLEEINKQQIVKPVVRVGIDTAQGYAPSYRYGSREIIREGYGIGRDNIVKQVMLTIELAENRRGINEKRRLIVD